MKKGLYCLILGCVILFFINSRTPFLQYSNGGPWSIGYGMSFKNLDELNVLDNKHVISSEEMKILDDDTNFLADPFFVKDKDTFYLFFEHQKINADAEIGLFTSADGENYKYRGTVLDEKFHLSYPHVFKHKGSFYMVPETKRASAILLYKAHSFPFGWKIEDTLIDNVKLKDPTLFLSDTLNIMVASDDELNLHMFKSDSLNGKWLPYKRSIIQRGTEARPGGRFFVDHKERLLLPLQNCSHGYGYGVSYYHFNFNNDKLNLVREYPLFLKRNDTIEYFNLGMHHIDIQDIDGEYHYVFDGNRKLDESKRLNLRGPIKWAYIDLIDAFEDLWTN